MNLLRRPNRHRAIDRRRDALDVRDELRVQADVEAARARHNSGVVNRLDHREHSESHALSIGRLRADLGRPGLDSGRSI